VRSVNAWTPASMCDGVDAADVDDARWSARWMRSNCLQRALYSSALLNHTLTRTRAHAHPHACACLHDRVVRDLGILPACAGSAAAWNPGINISALPPGPARLVLRFVGFAGSAASVHLPCLHRLAPACHLNTPACLRPAAAAAHGAAAAAVSDRAALCNIAYALPGQRLDNAGAACAAA
jgi:hypothetical protein